MRLTFYPDAWADYLDWQKIDRKRFKRLNQVIEDARRPPTRVLAIPNR